MDKEINAKIQVRNEYGEVVSAQEVFIDSRNLEKFGYVKVVRCKDCWKKDAGCSYRGKDTQGKDYCGDGERREESND